MVRIKFETATTGQGDLTVTVPAGFSNDVTQIRPPNDGYFQYVLVDANGTAWEHGYGKIAGSVFTRDYVVRSTNANTAIVLTTGTHTVLLPDGGLNNRVAQLRYSQTTAVPGGGGTATVAWNAYDQTCTTALDLPGAVADTLPTSYPGVVVPYARATQMTLYFRCTTVQTGYIMGEVINNNSYTEATVAATIPSEASWLKGSCTTPMLIPKGVNAGPVDGLGVAYGGDQKDFQVNFYNSGSGSLDVLAHLQIDYYL